MNKNQIEGSFKKTAGKIQQKVGEVTGSNSQQVKGASKRIEGSFQKSVGDVEQEIHDSTKKPMNRS
jgi:uncharacterized protein YjbJ (UPF0337 family)